MTTPSKQLSHCAYCNISDSQAACRLVVEQAGTGWNLLMQSGVCLDCMIGISVDALLREELKIPPDTLAKLDVFLLNGMPVDNPEKTVVPRGSRLALAAGLPGIAGLAMKSNSAVKGLRPGITHRQGVCESSGPAPGCIELALFSLALPLLAPRFLAKGIYLPSDKLLRYLRPGLQGNCFLDDAAVDLPQVQGRLASLPDGSLVFVKTLSSLSPAEG